ncbi:hypothetical protein AAHA92_13077 [Salvia divinorum]|uniref:Secreted protein n=1 Tax=Salvia divinorum TaxID=28513 RepID=A0ABD1H7Q6_SALDI
MLFLFSLSSVKFVCKAFFVGLQLYLDIAQEHARASISIWSGRQSWYYTEVTSFPIPRTMFSTINASSIDYEIESMCVTVGSLATHSSIRNPSQRWNRF